MSSSKVPKDVKASADVECKKEPVDEPDSSSSDSSNDRKISDDYKVKEKTLTKSKDAVAADESPSLEKYGGWIHPLATKKKVVAKNGSSSAVVLEEPNKIAHEEETPDKSSQPASSSSDDRPELPKRRKSTPHKKVGYKNKKKRQQLKRKTVDHQRRPPTLGDDRDVDGGACCRHCCCCRCHEVISYTHGEGASVGRRNVERFGRKPARLDRKRLTPKKTMLKKDRNSTPSPLRAKRRQLMEGQIEDDCLEDVRLASVIVNRGEECFRNAVAECGAKPKGCNNIDRATNLESQEP